MYHLGIDPGKSGGFALLEATEGASTCLFLQRMPPSGLEVWRWLSRVVPEHLPCRLYLEKVTGYVAPRSQRDEAYGDKGKSRQPGSAMFNFGVSYGALEMACLVLKELYSLPLLRVAPRTWQSLYALPPRGKGESQSSWKARLKAEATRLFPTNSPTLKTCDALLLAEYGRRCWEFEEAAVPSGGRTSLVKAVPARRG